MSFWSSLFGARSNSAGAPKASGSLDGGTLITSPEQLEQVMMGQSISGSGMSVTPETAMRVSTVFACVRIISSAVATLPISLKERVSERERKERSDHPISKVISKKPNQWQTPSQFRRMMETHLLLRGNAYALIVRSRGKVLGIIPLNPDRMKIEQLDDLTLSYIYTQKNGSRSRFNQFEMMHLVGMTLDGVHGVSPIKYARETIGLSLSMEAHGSATFKNGAQPSGLITHPGKLGSDGVELIQNSVDNYRANSERAGAVMVLEEAMEFRPISMTAEDAQWIESRKFSRSDIAAFFGVPPHMIGDTEKSTSWGQGLENQTRGFVAFTLEEHLTMWEETISRDLLAEDNDKIYARFNRGALVQGDIKTRTESYTRWLQWGIASPNEIRAMEDMNPREDGDIFYPPPNMTKDPEIEKGNEDDNPKSD